MSNSVTARKEKAMLVQEWKSLLKNRMLLIVLAGIIAIPAIYTTLFLGSMWDPYGNLSKLPVAVVNLDQSVEYEGATLRVGEELEDKLRENEELDFQFVKSEDAEKGLENGDYYMVITIPKDFSKASSTVIDEEPQKMQLEYSTNPAKNYIASKLSESAFARIKNEVANEVTKTYTETIMDQFVTIADGMQDGADGAEKIGKGTEKVKTGNQKIKANLEVLEDGCLSFVDGSEELTVGLKEYTQGVTKVADGSESLQSGAVKLLLGGKKLENGAKKLENGIKSLADGTKKLNENTPD